mmetsp:Transcript_24701/g.84483  ORF Transcript_24701/g.84483 Transcript_24701/m.84483 type:complete len:357 (+) Transcript_24701:1885-2955(+)
MLLHAVLVPHACVVLALGQHDALRFDHRLQRAWKQQCGPSQLSEQRQRVGHQLLRGHVKLHVLVRVEVWDGRPQRALTTHLSVCCQLCKVVREAERQPLPRRADARKLDECGNVIWRARHTRHLELGGHPHAVAANVHIGVDEVVILRLRAVPPLLSERVQQACQLLPEPRRHGVCRIEDVHLRVRGCDRRTGGQGRLPCGEAVGRLREARANATVARPVARIAVVMVPPLVRCANSPVAVEWEDGALQEDHAADGLLEGKAVAPEARGQRGLPVCAVTALEQPHGDVPVAAVSTEPRVLESARGNAVEQGQLVLVDARTFEWWIFPPPRERHRLVLEQNAGLVQLTQPLAIPLIA